MKIWGCVLFEDVTDEKVDSVKENVVKDCFVVEVSDLTGFGI